jgi:hypothetical protein
MDECRGALDSDVEAGRIRNELYTTTVAVIFQPARTQATLVLKRCLPLRLY